MPTAVIDGITTRYELLGSGPPLLMYAPGGFNATVEAWSTQGVYAKIKLIDHLPKKYTCILFDRRECGKSGGRVEHVTWAHYVAQGKGLRDHLGIARAHLMGGCMGCSPVAAFAVAHPPAMLCSSSIRLEPACLRMPCALSPGWGRGGSSMSRVTWRRWRAMHACWWMRVIR